MPSPSEALRRKKKYVRLPIPVLKFLLGIGPLEGVWFGERHPRKPGRFWWRSACFGKHYKRIDAEKAWPKHWKREGV